MMPIEIYTDGSSLKNPGASGLAYIIRYWVDTGADMPEEKTIQKNQGYRLSTNNRMEIMAALAGIKNTIECINSDNNFQGATQINVCSDSEYLCNAVNQRWINKWVQNNWMTSGFKSPPKAVKNKDLWEQMIELQTKLQQMSVTLNLIHVKGHNGNTFNEMADKLAVAASNDSANHQIDNVYEESYNNKSIGR